MLPALVAVVGDLLPQLGADPGGRGRGQAVDGDDTLDHVGEHGRPRPLPDPHRHDPAARPAPQGAVGADDPWRAAEARGHEPASPAPHASGCVRRGRTGPWSRTAWTDHAQRGARARSRRVGPAHARCDTHGAQSGPCSHRRSSARSKRSGAPTTTPSCSTPASSPSCGADAAAGIAELAARLDERDRSPSTSSTSPRCWRASATSSRRRRSPGHRPSPAARCRTGRSSCS